MKRLLRRWAPLLAFQALIFYSSSRAALPVAVSHWDKAVHFGAYAVLAWLWSRVMPGWPHSVGAASCAAAFGLTVLFGITDEFHQSFVPGRDASFADLAADASGALCSVSMLWLWSRRPGGESARARGI